TDHAESCKRSTSRRQPAKIRVIEDSVYNSKIIVAQIRTMPQFRPIFPQFCHKSPQCRKGWGLIRLARKSSLRDPSECLDV
ncbi:MAG: hypothetical protein ACI9AQ_002760, partial [Dinoroseobacter sp.]